MRLALRQTRAARAARAGDTAGPRSGVRSSGEQRAAVQRQLLEDALDWGSELQSDLLAKDTDPGRAGIGGGDEEDVQRGDAGADEDGASEEAGRSESSGGAGWWWWREDEWERRRKQLQREPLNLRLLGTCWRALLGHAQGRSLSSRGGEAWAAAHSLYAEAVVAARTATRAQTGDGRHVGVGEEEVHQLFGSVLLERGGGGNDDDGRGDGFVDYGWRKRAAEEAERSLRAAVAANGSHLPSLEALALLLDLEGRTQEALKVYVQAEHVAMRAQRAAVTRTSPGPAAPGMSIGALTNWGSLLDELGDTAKAHKCLVAALKGDANHVPALINLAALLSRSTTASAARSADRLWARALALLREEWRRAEGVRAGAIGVKSQAHGRSAVEEKLRDMTCLCLEGFAWLRCKRMGDAGTAVKMLQAAQDLTRTRGCKERIAAAVRMVSGEDGVRVDAGWEGEGHAAQRRRGGGTELREQRSDQAIQRLQEPTRVDEEDRGIDEEGRGVAKDRLQAQGAAERDCEEPGLSSGVDPDSSAPAVLNRVTFFAGKLRKRMRHLLDGMRGVTPPRARSTTAADLRGGVETGSGWVSQLLRAARDVSGQRLVETPPPASPTRERDEEGEEDHALSSPIADPLVPQPGQLFKEREQQEDDGKHSTKERSSSGGAGAGASSPDAASTMFEPLASSVQMRGLGRSSPLPLPEDVEHKLWVDEEGHLPDLSDAAAADYHPGFLGSSEVV
jgi:tetratricopeptide (TPR) repeat protein